MTRQRVALAAAFFILVFAAHPSLAAGGPGQTPDQVSPAQKAARPPAAPQPASEKAKTETKPEARSETIYPGPKDVRERSAVYVFLAWLWLTIAVLVYVLALKIREADRIVSFHYYHPDQGPERTRISS
jgi:hypothetical protein